MKEEKPRGPKQRTVLVVGILLGIYMSPEQSFVWQKGGNSHFYLIFFVPNRLIYLAV